jgi:hypothetical protein
MHTHSFACMFHDLTFICFLHSSNIVIHNSKSGMAEWWVLANADYLVANAGSSFAATATAWGLGPDGYMLRFDEVSETMRTNGKHSVNDRDDGNSDDENDVGAIRTDWRRDWDDRAGEAANTCYPRVVLSQCEMGE